MSQAMQFEAIRTISIMDTMKVTPDTGAEEIKQKNLLTNLLKLTKGVARKVEPKFPAFMLNYVRTYNYN